MKGFVTGKRVVLVCNGGALKGKNPVLWPLKWQQPSRIAKGQNQSWSQDKTSASLGKYKGASQPVQLIVPCRGSGWLNTAMSNFVDLELKRTKHVRLSYSP